MHAECISPFKQYLWEHNIEFVKDSYANKEWWYRSVYIVIDVLQFECIDCAKATQAISSLYGMRGDSCLLEM